MTQHFICMSTTVSNGSASDRCSATTFVRDDRWGGWENQCELPSGHEGEHRHAMTACEPVAWLVWEGRYRELQP